MPTVGVFDSGFGGLTVLREVMDKIPQVGTEYFADSGRNPYGVRPREEILEYSRQILDFLGGKGIDLAIVACNTATAAAWAELKDAYRFPILGVIRAGAKSAVAATQSKKVGVIATEFTTRSRAYSNVIKTLDAEIEVVGQACMRLVKLVETGNTAGEVARTVIREDLAVFRDTGVDTLVLGCTHFPLLASLIAEAVGPGVALVDSAKETAAEALVILRDRFPHLAEAGECAGRPQRPEHRFYTSGDPVTFVKLGSAFLGRGIPYAERIVLPD